MEMQQNKEEKPKTRLEALSDGTFAIVFTILVLELIIRDMHFNNAEAFKNHLLSLAPKFLSYSFVCYSCNLLDRSCGTIIFCKPY